MDNLCHTLVGAACAEAGLRQRTRWGGLTLLVASNLPDLDVLVFATSVLPVSFRRGWTHGVLAQLALPILWVGVLLAVDWWRRPRDGGVPFSAPDPRPPLRPGWLLALACLGVYSHVFLDYLNNYGVRVLAPVDWRWFYGDAVFIVDPWLWLSLGIGVWVARTRRSPRPARVALAAAALYVAVMVVLARDARATVADAWRHEAGTPPRAWMVGPRPVVPWEREVILDAGDHYRIGRYSAWSGRVTLVAAAVPKRASADGVAAARRDADVAAFLSWSRFPVWTVEDAAGVRRVTVGDMRFRDRAVSQFTVTTAGPAGAGQPPAPPPDKP